MKKSRLLIVLVLLACVASGCFLIFSAAAQAPSVSKSPDEAYQQIFQDQIARTRRYEGLLARQEEMMKRQEDLMKRQEEGAMRFLNLLEKWDKQQLQYQKYLDSLGKK